MVYAVILTLLFIGTTANAQTAGDSCKIRGDPHLETLDGAKFTHLLTCTTLLMKTADSSALEYKDDDEFSIVGENSLDSENIPNTYTSEVRVDYKGVTYTLKDQAGLEVAGKTVELSTEGGEYKSDDSSVTITRNNCTLTLILDDRVKVEFDGRGAEGRHDVTITPLKTVYATQLTGLCGNWNGESSDDLSLSNGTPSRDSKAIAKSYAIGVCDD